MRRPLRWMLASLALTSSALLAGCASGGHFRLFGYTTEPTYDCGIRTVYVPIFENISFRRGLEFDLTRAVIREIEAKTPYKVVNCRDQADTELIGKIVNRSKNIVLGNPLGEIREGELTMAVELTWLDLRPGNVGQTLTRPDMARGRALRDRRGGVPGEYEETEPLDRQAPLLDPTGKPLPVLVQPTATFVPELGGSVASAERQLVNRVAIQIVSMMERPW